MWIVAGKGPCLSPIIWSFIWYLPRKSIHYRVFMKEGLSHSKIIAISNENFVLVCSHITGPFLQRHEELLFSKSPTPLNGVEGANSNAQLPATFDELHSILIFFWLLKWMYHSLLNVHAWLTKNNLENKTWNNKSKHENSEYKIRNRIRGYIE